MAWVYLLFAGCFEIGFTTFLKLTEGFTRVVPSIFFFIFSIMSFWCLNRAIIHIPLGMAYAIWTGIGAAGTAFIGYYFFNDQLSTWQGLLIVNVIASIVGLKLLA
jgi:quaternary ammonium compound-resistance protein SugE